MNEESLDEILIDDNHGYKEEVQYAGFWIRFGAAWIDGLIFLPIFHTPYLFLGQKFVVKYFSQSRTLIL